MLYYFYLVAPPGRKSPPQEVTPLKRPALPRPVRLALGLLVCLALSGCSFSGFQAQNLMSPPRANLDQQGIYELLQEDRQELNFVYPKRGEHRSAIIMRDWTGDGEQDAVGFVALDEGGAEAYFLTKEEGRWRCAASFVNTASQVDMVCFGDLNGDGREDVLIGWGSTAGTTGRTAAVSAYLYTEEGVEEQVLGPYGEMALTDFDRDGSWEVFTVDKYLPAEEEGSEPLPAMAHVFAWEGDSLQEVRTAYADNSIASYTSISFGNLSRGVWGVVLDGAKADGSMTTQVFYIDWGLLKNAPAGVNTETYQNPFSRPSTAVFASQDINGDQVVEIPVVTQLPCIPEGASLDSTSYLVEWSVFRSLGEYKTVLPALMNLGENYWFRLPQQLIGKISASNDTQKRTVTYTEVVTGEDGSQLLGAPLFAIRVFTRSAWESRGETSGYLLLAQRGDLVYGMQPLTQDEAYASALEQIQESFKLAGE